MNRKVSRSRPKVLIVTYGGGHAAMIAPVAAELRRRGGVELTLLGLTTAGALFSKRELAYKGYRDYLSPEHDQDALRLGEQLLADVNTEQVGVTREESIAYMGMSMRDLVREVGETAAWDSYRRKGRHAFLQKGVMREIIRREDPALVVATTSPKSERAAIEVGNQMGKTTLIVPDMFADAQWESYTPFRAQWFGAMCTQTKENLIRDHGADPERIVITGQPAFDKSAVPSPEECHAYVQGLVGVPEGRPYVVVLTSMVVGGAQPSSEQSIAAVRLLAEGKRHFPDVDFVIKPHPSEPEIPYREIAAGKQGVWLAPAQADVNRVIRGGIAAVATCTTTAIVDALSLDRPVLALYLGSARPFGLQMGVLPVTDLGDLTASLRRLLEDRELLASLKGQRASLAEANQGAIMRVADLVSRLAGDGVGGGPEKTPVSIV